MGTSHREREQESEETDDARDGHRLGDTERDADERWRHDNRREQRADDRDRREDRTEAEPDGPDAERTAT
ncbi:hypothetical protein [Natronorarus salvus]|uniref:hypothetical protein n=1 Tax=Natronorarus salvus TaxID=3117733 RepID=UPI002F268852